MDTQLPQIKVHQIIFKKSPPIIGVVYSKDHSSEKFYHNVNIYLEKAKSAIDIVEELQREELVYFGSHLIKKEQLLKLISTLFEKSPTKSDDSSGSKKKKSLRDRLNLPIHQKKTESPKKPFEDHIESIPQNSEEEQNPNNIAIVDDENPENHHLQKVFVEEANQEFLMDSTGNLYDMEGNCVGKAQYDDEVPPQ